MLNKYKITIFHSLCMLCFLVGCFFLKPFLFVDYPQPCAANHSNAVIHKQTKTTIWKEGKYKSTTVLKEQLATTENFEEITHKSKGWTSINWRRHDP